MKTSSFLFVSFFFSLSRYLHLKRVKMLHQSHMPVLCEIESVPNIKITCQKVIRLVAFRPVCTQCLTGGRVLRPRQPPPPSEHDGCLTGGQGDKRRSPPLCIPYQQINAAMEIATNFRRRVSTVDISVRVLLLPRACDVERP